MYPDRVCEELWKRTSYSAKWAFFACLSAGLAAHFYMFANKLPNYDDINNLAAYGAGASSGRFFLDFLGRCVLFCFGNFSMPWLYGLAALFFLAIAAAVIVDILQVRSRWSCFLAGAVLAVFPAMTATLFFMYTVPYYTFGILLTAVSVLLVCRYRNVFAFIAAVVILAFSVGIYQAYIPLAAGIMVLLTVQKCLDLKVREILTDTIRYLLLLVAALALYLVLNQIALRLYGQEMAVYKGLDQMGKITLPMLIERIRIAYHEFFLYFLENRDGINPYPIVRLMSIGTYIISIAGICIGIIKIGRTKKKGRFLCCAGLTAAIFVFPLAVNGIYLLAEKNSVYSIMRYPMVLVYIMGILILEYFQRSEIFACNLTDRIWARAINTAKIMICWIGTVMIFGSMCSNIYYANTQYLAMDMQYKQAYSYFISMITEIKLTDGYEADLPIVLIGDTIEDESFYQNEDFAAYGMSGRSETLLNEYSRDVFWKKYIGFDHLIEDEGPWESLPEVQAMPCYPQKGSIQVIDGAVVLKLQEIENP